MSKGIRVLVALILGTSLLFVACGGDEPEDTTTQEDTSDDETKGDETTPAAEEEPAGDDGLAVTAFDFGFREEELTAPAGEVTLTFRNTGKAPHTFTIEKLSVDVAASPGETVESTFTVPSGSYDFFCSIHPEMVGKLLVQ